MPCQCPHWMDTCTCVPQTPPEHGVLCKMLHLEYICEANIPEDTLTHTQLTTTRNADNCALSEPLRGTIMLRLMGNDPQIRHHIPKIELGVPSAQLPYAAVKV